jgi:hypothetical protein
MDQITLAKKKEYISNVSNNKDFVDLLEKKDLVEIGNMVKRAGLSDMLKFQQDGCRINLDLIQNECLINQIYTYLKYKV